MSDAFILVLNCGSSSIKFGLYDAGGSGDPPRRPAWAGKIDGVGSSTATLRVRDADVAPIELPDAHPYPAALDIILDAATGWLSGRRIVAVAHRVVHGGSRYSAPVRVDPAVLADLRTLVPLAPLHQPYAIDAIEAMLRKDATLPQIACFDTAFHHTMPLVEQLLPLPYAAWERGLRRYGFHGLSYEYMAVALAERHGRLAHGRTIVAHLGSGASLCAMKDLRSVGTTMGFSALDGLMMGTRTGALDPGAVLYLMEIEKLSLAEVGHALYHASGLLGVSGVSADPRELLAREADTPRAALALSLWVHRAVREIGAMTAVLGGLDLLVFTAGIGEHSDALRGRIVAGLDWLGLAIDPAANAAHAPRIDAAGSRVAVAIEPTDEEWIAARHARRLRAGA